MTIRARSTCCFLAVAAALASAGAGAQRLSTACVDVDVDVDVEATAEAAPLPRMSARDSLHAEIHEELRAEVRRAAVAAGIAEPGGYLALQHDRRTGRATHRLLRGNVPERVIADAHRRMAARLSESPKPEAVLFFGMRLEPDPSEIAAERSIIVCEPELLNVRTLQGRLGSVLERTAPQGNPPMSTILRMMVTRDGEVAYAYLEQPTGNVSLDSEIVRRVAPSLRFAPARVNEYALDGWVRLPITFPAREPPPPPQTPQTEPHRFP